MGKKLQEAPRRLWHTPLWGHWILWDPEIQIPPVVTPELSVCFGWSTCDNCQEFQSKILEFGLSSSHLRISYYRDGACEIVNFFPSTRPSKHQHGTKTMTKYIKQKIHYNWINRHKILLPISTTKCYDLGPGKWTKNLVWNFQKPFSRESWFFKKKNK